MYTNHLLGNTQCLSLTTITVELVLLVCTYLKGKDIISLRQTCKYLEEVTRERTLWLDAVRRACRDNALYQPSFDLPNMSIQEMEYTSMGVHRFQRLARSTWVKAPCSDSAPICEADSQTPGTHPTWRVRPATRMSRIYLPVNRYWSTQFQKIELVRGGRFLVTLEGSGRFRIYDLSCLRKTVGVRVLDPSPCVSIDMGECARYFTLHASPDPNVLKIFFEFDQPDDDTDSAFEFAKYIAEIVDVDLSFDTPIIKRYEKVNIPIPSRYALPFQSVNKGDLVITIGYQITLGSLHTKMFAKWRLPAYSSQVILTDTEVVVISCYTRYEPQKQAASVLIYKRPPLTLESVALIDYEPPELSPDIILPLPADIDPYILTRAIHDGYTGSMQPTWFDLIHSTSPIVFTRIMLLKNMDGQYTLDALPSSAPKAGPDYDQFPKEAVYGGDGKISSWWCSYDRSQIYCSLEDIFPGSGGRLSDTLTSGVLSTWDAGGPYWAEGSFCGVSGRLVVLPLSGLQTHDEVEERREVLVIDSL